MTARLLKLAYQLRHYALGDWALGRWALVMLLGAAAASAVFWGVSGWRGLIPALLLTVAGALLGFGIWAARRQYLVFAPQAELPAPPPQALDPDDKLAHRATGRFEVAGRGRTFADLPAYWRTFATGEHTVMAFVPDERFLGVARTPEAHVGMWYIFFGVHEVTAVTPGLLTFGQTTRPALRVAYRTQLTAPLGRAQPPPKQPVAQTVTLAFDDETARSRVWGDLLAGADS